MFKKIAIKSIKTYQKYFSPEKGLFTYALGKNRSVCVFDPTCSEYSISAFEKYGFIKALLLSLSRILRCHPWQKEHLDPLE